MHFVLNLLLNRETRSAKDNPACSRCLSGEIRYSSCRFVGTNLQYRPRPWVLPIGLSTDKLPDSRRFFSILSQHERYDGEYPDNLARTESGLAYPEPSGPPRSPYHREKSRSRTSGLRRLNTLWWARKDVYWLSQFMSKISGKIIGKVSKLKVTQDFRR